MLIKIVDISGLQQLLDAGAGAGVLKRGRVGSKPGVGVSKMDLGVSKIGVGGSKIFVHDLHVFQYKNNTWNLKFFSRTQV